MKLRTVLAIAFGICAVCCLGVVFGGLSCFRAAAKEQTDAENYLRQVLPKIGNPWSADALRAESNADLKAAASKEDMEKLVELLDAKLGTLTGVQDFKFNSWNVSTTTETGRRVELSGNAYVTFQKGKGDIEFTLVKQDDVWKFQKFKVDSPLLAGAETPSNK